MTKIDLGSQVVFTSLETHNKEDLVKSTIDAGYIVGPGVSKKTSLLVAGDPNVDSSKARKAREYGIDVISEDEYVATYLGGEVVIDFEAAPYPAPRSVQDISPPKRDVKELKETLKGIRTGLPLHAHVDGEFGVMVVRGPATFSVLGEVWMVGGIPIANKALTPEKSLRLLGAAAGNEEEHRSVDLFANHVEHHHYGNFTVYGPIRNIIGSLHAVGPWIIIDDGDF